MRAGRPRDHVHRQGTPVSPRPRPREGLGGVRPPRNKRMFIAAWCGAAAWTAEVTIVRQVQPPSQPPPAGGRRQVPAPSGGGLGKGAVTMPAETRCGRDARAIMFIAREPRFPHAPARGKVRTQPARRGMGQPGFPILPPGGRVWEGAARAQGDGETRFPHIPVPGRVWEGAALPRTTSYFIRWCAAQPHGWPKRICAKG